jgi:predicted NBD/HSP70 family sugar kinase
MGRTRSNAKRDKSRELIIEKLLLRKEITRQDLIIETGLAPSTISGIISDLINDGMVQKIGAVGSAGFGRKIDILKKVPEYSAIISISLTLENSNISLIDFGLNAVATKDLGIDPENNRDISDILIDAIKGFSNQYSNRNIVAVSLALPHHPFQGNRIKQRLVEALNLPLLILNNVEAMAVFDYYSRPAGTPDDTVFYIYVGKGIGSAFIINGHLYRGLNGLASDLGHIHNQDILCRCGRTGCLETVASEESLKRAMEKHLNRELNSYDELIDQLMTGLEEHNEKTLEILSEAAAYLSEGIHTVISLLDPSKIVLSSRLNRIRPYYASMVESQLYERFLKRSPFSVQREYTDFNRSSGVNGAALYAYLCLFCKPDLLIQPESVQ